jgi:tetratricopeptide (TPR) repeat protein
MYKAAIILLFILINLPVFGQEKNLKEQALDEFKKEHYSEAIGLLEQAVKQTPEDAELYYYLGWFNHYRAYDSRPLSGHDFSYSEQIFRYLDKALELNPDYGDAKYFYGAECSGNAFFAMQNYDAEKLKYFYKLADEKGAYPLWLKEFGRNFLNSCDTNAIVFTGGNADFDICSYLQLHESVRTDITIIPIGNIERPWYVRFLKKGLSGCVRNVVINLTDEQIMDIHPFKWDTTTVSIPVSTVDKKKFGLDENAYFEWQINPDLFSERMHSKIESEKAKRRTYLSPRRAIMLQIVEDNFAQRPIYFSNFASPTFYGGLEQYFQNCGLVSRLTPVVTKSTDFAMNSRIMSQLLQKENLTDFKSLIDNNIPRISGVIVAGYYSTLSNLLEIYNRANDLKGKENLQQLFNAQLKIGYDTEWENEILNIFEDK